MQNLEPTSCMKEQNANKFLMKYRKLFISNLNIKMKNMEY